ncbi:transposase [Ferrimicrobium acidiphilum]|uniref:transposase n=1 Tax=Ferrimicrobium acidiphilum TaxID=121039 RepID=UPI001F386ED3|nr:transposase [Ferrimicrobium acidiphilum]
MSARTGGTFQREQVAHFAGIRTFVTNGPTESMNNLIKRIKRIAFGMTNFANFRIRALLSAGKPDWSLLATVTPVTTHISSALGS